MDKRRADDEGFDLAATLTLQPPWRQRRRSGLAAALSTVLVATLVGVVPTHAAAAPPAPAAKPACPDSRPDQTSAVVAARLCGGRVLISSATTARTQVWAERDGTLTSEISQGDVRVSDGKGGWNAVDLRLVARPDGTIVPAVSPQPLVLSGGAGDGDHDVAVLGSGDSQVALGWRGNLPKPLLEGTKATYANVRPGVDLVIEATRSGFEQLLIVKNKGGLAHVRSIAMPWRTGELSAKQAPHGLELRNKAGVVAAQIHNAVMWDARTDAVSGLPAHRAPVGVNQNPGVAGRSDLVLTPDVGLLDDPDLLFPLTIDPVVDVYPGTDGDTYTESDAPNTTYWGSSELLLGTYNGGGVKARSYLRFDVTPYYGSHINKADLKLWETWSYSCSPAEWQLWRTGYFDYTTTWNSNPQLLTYINNSTVSRGHDSGCAPGEVTIDAAPWFQAAADSFYPYWAMGLVAGNENNTLSWKRFSSSDGAHPPYVVLNYNAPPTVSGLTTTPTTSGCVSGSGRPWMTSTTPHLSATVTDQESTAALTFEWAVTGGATISSGSTGQISSGYTGSVDVPTGQLSNGGTYSWRVKATDTGGVASPWSSWCEFTVDSVAPGVPFVTSAQYPENGRGTSTSGTFTFAPATGNADVVAFVYKMDTDTSETTIAGTGPTNITITPSAEGHRTLSVKAKDTAGNLSSAKLYVFDVGRAGVSQPLPGGTAIKRMKIALDVPDTTLTRTTLQYRRGQGGATYDIPLANLTTATGTAIASYPVALSTLGGYAIWNAVDTLGPTAGLVDVRACMWTAGDSTCSYTTAWVSATVDPNGDTAAASSIGPGSVNLLTGDYSLSSTDVDELGLSAARSSSSRDPGVGWVPQGERLTPNQQQATTDLTGLNTYCPSAVSRATGMGQGSSTESVKITTTNCGSDSYIYPTVTLVPGKRYRVSGWIYVPSSTGLNSGWYGWGQSIIIFTNGSGGVTRFYSGGASFVDAWQQMSVEFEVPAGTTSYLVQFFNGNGSAGKTVYWDNLSVRELVAPFGPAWRGGTIDGPTGNDYTSLDIPSADVARLNTSQGGWITFGKSGNTFYPQPGAESLTLVAVDASTYELRDLDGSVMRFTQSGASNSNYVLASTRTPDDASTTTYTYDTSDYRTLVTRVINPVETGVSGCGVLPPTAPARGCEVLEYVYASTTTATSTVFGDVKDQVSAVRLFTWDPVAGVESAVDVVRYNYDDQRRLREVWDPRGGTTLKTTYEYDGSGRVVSVTPPGELPYTFDYGSIAADPNPGRLHRVRRAALQQGSATVTDVETVTRLVYQVPLTRAAGGPNDMNFPAIATWGQSDLPTDATAVFEPEDDPFAVQATSTTPGADGYRAATVHYLNASAKEVNTASPHPAGVPGSSIDSTQYDRFGNTVWTLESTNRLLALGQLPNSATMLADLGLSGVDTAGRALALATVNKYSLDGVDLLETTGPTNKLVVESGLADPDGSGPLSALPEGSTVVGRAHTTNIYDEGRPDGLTYHLLTTRSSGVAVAGYADADTRVTRTGYAAEKGGTSGWQLKKSTSITTDAGPGGSASSAYTVYDATGRVTSTWSTGANGNDVRTMLTTFYTATANPSDSSCGNRPEWAGQPCVSRTAGPVTGQRPDMSSELTVSRVESYSRWGKATSTLDTSVGKFRRTVKGFDNSGRDQTVEITTDEGVGMPVMSTTYHATNGKVATVTAGDAVISRSYDLLGRQIGYTDADGGVTNYEFDRYGSLARVANNAGWTTYTYDRTQEPRGLLTSQTDSVAGTFTMKYSADGQLTEVKYPGGVTRRDTLDTNLEPVARTYTRDSDGTVLYAESTTANAHGQRVSDVYTGGSRRFSYDRQGRLTKVEQTTAAGCLTRRYDLDERTNRTAKSVFNPASDGSCRSDTADVVESHTYDSADRLTDPGYIYDAFGRTVATPGGVTNTFYASGLAASQTVDNLRRTWTVYGDQRARRATTETLSGSTWTATGTVLNHYGDDTDRPRWISENGTATTRYVSGPGDELLASTGASGDVRLRFVNLHSDVVMSIDTALSSPEVFDFDEFGLPSQGQAPQRYGWLGGRQRSAEALAGLVLMGVRLFSPTLGRFLQVDPVPGGSATAYDYCFGDAVNCTDLDGRWGWLKSIVNTVKEKASWVYNHASDIGTVVGIAGMIAGPFCPPCGVVLGGVSLAFNLVGAVKDIQQGSWGGFALTLAGAIPGVGALSKGIRAIGTLKKLKVAKNALDGAEKLKGLIPKAQRLREYVRPWRKAATGNNKAWAAVKPWEKAAGPFSYIDGGRMACKYWTSCRNNAPYGKWYL